MNCLSCDILSSKSTGSIALLCGGLQIFVSRFLRSLSLFLSLFLFFSFLLGEFTLEAAGQYGNHYEAKASLETLVLKKGTV